MRTPDGVLAGTNRVARIQGGCALQESWEGARGSTGTSLNTFDAGRARWHQTWVDSHGSLLLLDGTLKGGKMVLSGSTPSVRGSAVIDRISWQPMDGGDVRQLWEQSSDGGKTWMQVFDGRYHRRG